MPRCMYCGQETDEQIGNVSDEWKANHGPGLCCSPCQYCREGTMHAAHVCGESDPKSQPMVQAFNEHHGHY